jgi:hypothetical protein
VSAQHTTTPVCAAVAAAAAAGGSVAGCQVLPGLGSVQARPGAGKSSSRLPGVALHSPLQLCKVAPPACPAAVQHDAPVAVAAAAGAGSGLPGSSLPQASAEVAVPQVCPVIPAAAGAGAGAIHDSTPAAAVPWQATTPAGAAASTPAAAAGGRGAGGLCSTWQAVSPAGMSAQPALSTPTWPPVVTPVAAGPTPSWLQAATPAGTGPATAAAGACITEQSVLQVLWEATCTAPELVQKLGAHTPQQVQQLQHVLEGLLEAGDQVVTTPQCSRVDVRNANIRFIAF